MEIKEILSLLKEYDNKKFGSGMLQLTFMDDQSGEMLDLSISGRSRDRVIFRYDKIEELIDELKNG